MPGHYKLRTMNNEKTITICGKEVKLLYCAATENGYEQLAKKSIGEIDFSKQEDLLRLSVAAIIAAYQRDKQESPIESQDILYDAKPKDIIELFKAVLEARAAWYDVPLILEESIKAEKDYQSDEAPKNA